MSIDKFENTHFTDADEIGLFIFDGEYTANSEGTFNIIVPVSISAVAPSEIIGPVSEVYVPPTVSAEIAEPPVAGVTVAVAKTFLGVPKRQNNTIITKSKSLFFIYYIMPYPQHAIDTIYGSDILKNVKPLLASARGFFFI